MTKTKQKLRTMVKKTGKTSITVIHNRQKKMNSKEEKKKKTGTG